MKTFFPVDEHFINPFFIATVEDNKDTTFNYRVKVRIPVLHPELITTEQLPWAARVDSTFMGISDEADLNHKVPEIGSQVLVLAIGNDPNSLVYLGNLYKKTAQTPTDEEKYINTYGIYRKDGQFIGIDKVEKLFQMLFDGNVDIDKIKEMTIKVETAITIETETATINAKDVIVKGGHVTIEDAQTNAFTCLPNCLFTGGKHTINKSS